MAPFDPSEIARWLIDGARSAPQAEQLLQALCERLVAAGLPLWRVGVFVRTLHPQIMGRRFLWQEARGVGVRSASYAMLDTPEFRGSPVTEVYNTGLPLRRCLADPLCPNDFVILDELRDEGATDYIASPLIFTDGAVHVVTWATRQPGGFTPPQLAGIEAILAPLARVAEIRAWQRTAASLLDTYVGNTAGAHILSGNIRRGDTQAINSAIWLSDMRDSTALAGRLPPDAFFDLLNRYFDCQVPAIVDHGGEVLKFIGDGLLAIFPTAGDGNDPEICRRALRAAQIAAEEIAGLAVPGAGHVRFGLALHLGRVLYGNIGSGSRLDFTCIGPAVHLAARIEKLAGEAGHTILTSEEFAHGCGAGLAPVGSFRLAGFSAEQRLYRPVD